MATRERAIPFGGKSGTDLNFQIVGGLPVYPEGDEPIILTNIADSSEFGSYDWTDYGSSSGVRATQSFEVTTGHRYFVRCSITFMTYSGTTGAAYTGYVEGGGAKASGYQTPATYATTYSNAIWEADSDELTFSLYVSRANLCGHSSGYVDMIVDVTNLDATIAGTADQFWASIGEEVFYGSKAISPPSGNSVSLTISASHANNGNSTSITIVDNLSGSTLASNTINGTTYYSVFTDQVIEFVTSSGLNGSLKCSVRQNTQPFFSGTVFMTGTEIGTVGIGTGQTNSSYAWSGSQIVTYEFKSEGQPPVENPTENTIWVNTDEKITGWAFSANEPAASTGMVWLRTNPSSLIAFNALRENTLEVNPILVQQYINDVWEEKTATIYQNGAWKQIVGDIQIIPNLLSFPDAKWSHSNGGSFNAAGEIETDTIGSTYYYHRLLIPIDLTAYKTIKFSFTYENSNVAYVGVAKSVDASYGSWTVQAGGTQNTYSLDVTDLKGLYYIAMYGWPGNASSNRKWTVKELQVLL